MTDRTSYQIMERSPGKLAVRISSGQLDVA
jgi:hypothetical protein